MPTSRIALAGHHPRVAVSDSFNRANSATSLGNADSGQAWTAGSGTWGISSNRAYCPTPSGNSFAWVDSGKADNFTVSVTIAAAGSGSAGLVLRAVDQFNLILVSSGSAGIFARVGGSYNTITPTSGSYTMAVGDQMGVSVSGGNYTVYKNGAAVCTFTDNTDFLTATKHGLRVNNDSSILFDNFLVV